MDNNLFQRANSSRCIVDYVKQTVALLREGNRFRGLCPFHDEKTGSFTVWIDQQTFHCFGCGKRGDLIDFVVATRGCSKLEACDFLLNQDRIERSLINKKRVVKQTQWPAIDWKRINLSFWRRDSMRLASWRKYSLGFCEWLRKSGQIGMHDGCIAFPIHQQERIVRAHCRPWHQGRWFYWPREVKASTSVLRLGNGKCAHLFESQWDLFAALDQTDQWKGTLTDSWIATRGAANSRKMSGLVFDKVFIYPQSDTAGKKWSSDCLLLFPESKVIECNGNKDVNDFTASGGRIEKINPWFS